MHFCTEGIAQDYGATGVLYDLGSVYEGLGKLTDIRKAKGKLYGLETVLMIVVLAKLCGEDTPFAIADWAKNHQEELVQFLQLKRTKMPSHTRFGRSWRMLCIKKRLRGWWGNTTSAANKGHGRIETRTITTSEMLNAYAAWPGVAQVYRLKREFQWWRKGHC